MDPELKNYRILTMGKFFTVFVLIIISSGCVGEDLGSCPDWGKYRVLFYDKNPDRNEAVYNVVIQYGTGYHRYVRTLDTTRLISDNLLKLLPGKYSFKALLSRTQIETVRRPAIKNGFSYLFADTSANIVKTAFNHVVLDLKLANSMIVVKCHFDAGHNESHQIIKIEVSGPDDDSVKIDMFTGLSNYAQTISSFYEECLYDIKQDSFYYYCVPVICGNYLNFRIYIRDTNDMSIKVLLSRIFLNTSVGQGKVYIFHFNVTPYKIEYMTTSVIDWEDYCHKTIITFY